VTGRAVVAVDAADALARVEPGDVLITTMTAPGFNAALAVVAGLVTEQGGPLSHAAIMARELGLPTVLGLAGAASTIPDGATVLVDPVAATVEVVR
jgi:pyruvate,water dikinase